MPLFQKKETRNRSCGSLALWLRQRLDAEEAHDAERLFDEAASRRVRIELVEPRRTRNSTDEANGRRNDLLDHGVPVKTLDDEVENIVTRERVVELRHIDEGRLRPSLLDELVDGVTMLVDLRQILGATERDAELEGVLARVEVALALGLSGRHDNGEVADDLVEILILPLGGSLGVRESDFRNLHIVSEVGVVENTVGLVTTEVVAEERNGVLVELEREGESGTVGLIGRSLLTDSSHALLLEFAREDALREADDCSLLVVPVVASERRLSVVAIRTDGAREFADTEDHALLEPFTNGCTTEKFVSLASLGHDRDETVHPVLEELNWHLIAGCGYACGGHSVHNHLEVHVGLHADAETVKRLDRASDALGGVQSETFPSLLLREVVEVLCDRRSKHFVLSFL